MRRALRARQERMQQSALELQRQVRRFRNNMQRIAAPTRPRPETDEGDEAPEQVQG